MKIKSVLITNFIWVGGKLMKEKLNIIEKLIKKGEVLVAENLADKWGISQQKVQSLIIKYNMQNVKRVWG